jgi:SAM-dependent methyltransferase
MTDRTISRLASDDREQAALARFAADYSKHRAAEGRGHDGDELLALPYLRQGPLARQWAVRARSFEAFHQHVMQTEARRLGRPLRLLDLGAGNGWLCYRAALEGHSAVALDIRDDAVDGLGAAQPFLDRVPGQIDCVVAGFDAIPLEAASVDIAIFNASLHYTTDLARSLAEAARVVRPGGRIAILDTPFYVRASDGEAMVAEKRADASARFGDRADSLLALPFIEFLTRNGLHDASVGLDLDWQRRRVRYPLWYEFRPLQAALRRQRKPSRFDLWVSVKP